MWKDVQNILLEKQEVVNKCIQYDFISKKLKHTYTYMYIFKDLSLRNDLLFTFSFDSNLSESTFFCLKVEYYIRTSYISEEVLQIKYVKAVCKQPYIVQVHASQMSLNIDDFHNLQYNRSLIF